MERRGLAGRLTPVQVHRAKATDKQLMERRSIGGARATSSQPRTPLRNNYSEGRSPAKPHTRVIEWSPSRKSTATRSASNFKLRAQSPGVNSSKGHAAQLIGIGDKWTHTPDAKMRRAGRSACHSCCRASTEQLSQMSAATPSFALEHPCSAPWLPGSRDLLLGDLRSPTSKSVIEEQGSPM